MKKQLPQREVPPDPPKKEVPIEEVPPPPPIKITAFQKIKRVNALTSCLSNNNFLKAVESLEEGSFILEVFAKAIESELENMFQNNQKLEATNFPFLVKQIDTCYAKAQAIAASPVQQILERLMANLGGDPQQNQHQQQEPMTNEGMDSPRRRGEQMGF